MRRASVLSSSLEELGQPRRCSCGFGTFEPLCPATLISPTLILFTPELWVKWGKLELEPSCLKGYITWTAELAGFSWALSHLSGGAACAFPSGCVQPASALEELRHARGSRGSEHPCPRSKGRKS